VIRLFEAADSVQRFCQEQGWRFCFIGGLALQRWGEPRLTRDIDIEVFTGFGGESGVIRVLLGRFESRIGDASEFALQRRVLLLKTKTGIGIDIALGALPFEESAVRRATFFSFTPEISLLTCSAEDLIVFKAFADRGQDWVDIENILVRQGRKLDWRYVLTQLKPLVDLKEAPQILDRLDVLWRACED
jgi:hypothetical protein